MSFQIRPLKEFLVRPALPAALHRLSELGVNLLWSWDHTLRALFRRLDPVIWKASNYNPVVMLGRVSARDAGARGVGSALPGDLPARVRILRRLSGRARECAVQHDGGVFLDGVRSARLHADLLGRLGGAFGRSSEGLERRDAAAYGHRACCIKRVSATDARSRRLAAGTHADQRFLLTSRNATIPRGRKRTPRHCDAGRLRPCF